MCLRRKACILGIFMCGIWLSMDGNCLSNDCTDTRNTSQHHRSYWMMTSSFNDDDDDRIFFPFRLAKNSSKYSEPRSTVTVYRDYYEWMNYLEQTQQLILRIEIMRIHVSTALMFRSFFIFVFQVFVECCFQLSSNCGSRDGFDITRWHGTNT